MVPWAFQKMTLVVFSEVRCWLLTALASCHHELCLVSQLDLAEGEAARAMLSAVLCGSLLQACQPLLRFSWKLSAGGAGSISHRMESRPEHMEDQPTWAGLF